MPANVSYDYAYDYTYFNLALAGRSKSSTDVEVMYFIIPELLAGNHSPDPMSGYPFSLFALLNDASYMGLLSLDYAKQYDIVGGYKEASGQQTGSKDLGTMGVGDRLYMFGGLGAYTECENYFEGLTVATMFPSFTGTLYAESAESVPEPASILLLGMGLVVIGFWRARWKFKK